MIENEGNGKSHFSVSVYKNATEGIFRGSIISGLFVIDDYFDDDRRETYKEMLTIIDDQKELLKQKTLTYSLGTICSDGPVRDHERNRSESLCILEASESVSGRMTNKNAYEACMMKRGWSVRECQDGEQGCVILQTGTGCCNQIGLKTALENISPRCLVIESEEAMISRWESICSSRANIEGIEKSMHSELFKIITIYESYKSCMLEQGFYTEQCEMSDEGCVKLLYHESTCTSTIRDWLENRIDENDIVLNKCFAKNNNDFF